MQNVQIYHINQHHYEQKEEHQNKIKAENGGNCQTTNLIYAVICTRHNAICVGQTGCSLASRFSKHRHDIKNRPDNTEIAEHFHKGHQEGDMKAMILQQDFLSPRNNENTLKIDGSVGCRACSMNPRLESTKA